MVHEPAGEVPYGTLDLMVLKTLQVMGRLHGYAIARRIEQVAQGSLALNQGTIYPALLRLAEHPANGVDDVGLAATVGPNNAHQVSRKFYCGCIDERLEARKLDLTQAQLFSPRWSSFERPSWPLRRR